MHVAEYLCPFRQSRDLSGDCDVTLYLMSAGMCSVGLCFLRQLHSGQTPDRRMAEASSKKRIVSSVACEILAHAQECTSDCARMHRLELDEPNVRPGSNFAV